MESTSIALYNFNDFYTSNFLEGKGKRRKTALEECSFPTEALLKLCVHLDLAIHSKNA